MATSHHRQCSICLEDVKRPKFLDCHHSFCLECVRSLENKTPGFINCPVCQKKVQLPSTLVGVEGRRIVPRGFSSTYSEIDPEIELLQARFRSHQLSDNQETTVKTEQNGHKLIEMQLDYYIQDSHHAQFGGIVFSFSLCLKREEYMPDTMMLSIGLSETNEFIHSCNIDYDITFINHKDTEFSIRETGSGYVQSSQEYPYKENRVEVDLIREQDATNAKNGFIFKRSEDDVTFQLSVGITVSNIQKVNFRIERMDINFC